MANGEYSDEIAAFHRGQNVCSDNHQGQKCSVHHFKEILIDNPIKYKMDNSILYGITPQNEKCYCANYGVIYDIVYLLY